MTALVAIGTISIAYLSPFAPHILWLILGPVITGIGTAGILLLWAEEYSLIDTYIAQKYTLPSAMVTGVAIYLLTTMFPSSIGILITAALPVISIVFLRRTRSVPKCMQCRPPATVPTPPAQTSSQMGVLIKFLLIISIYCLAPGFLRGRTDSFSETNMSALGQSMFGGIAVILIIVALVSMLSMDRHDDTTYRMVVPLMAAGLLLMPFFANDTSSVMPSVAIMGGYIILEIFVWSTLQNIAKHARESPATVFGIGKSGMNLGLTAGTALGIYASSLSTMIVLGISVLIVYIFVLFGAVMPGAPNMRKLFDLTSEDKNDAPSNADGMMTMAEIMETARAEKCNELSARYDLSRREIDVLYLYSYGRSLNMIAKTLNIAPSTVKSHKDHIFQKLGIHSKQELLDLMGER